MLTAPQGERRLPLERIADLFYKVFRHADFTSSDVAVTLYLAAALQRLNRRRRVAQLLRADGGPGDGAVPPCACFHLLSRLAVPACCCVTLRGWRVLL